MLRFLKSDQTRWHYKHHRHVAAYVVGATNKSFHSWMLFGKARLWEKAISSVVEARLWEKAISSVVVVVASGGCHKSHSHLLFAKRRCLSMQAVQKAVSWALPPCDRMVEELMMRTYDVNDEA